MRKIVLVHEHYQVSFEYIGESVVLSTSTAFDVSPPHHTLKPHYFGTDAEAKGWMIRMANLYLTSGYEVAE